MDIQTIGLIASIITIIMFISPVDQIRDIIKDKTSHGVSPIIYGMMIINGICWVTYGFGINNSFIIVPNAVGAVLGAATLFIIYKYRSHKE
ncbi:MULTISPECIES: SemiSWEET family transporter [Methanobacterium]|jgi:solute carrier family 50 protein (sugar transporter)|uniref:Sugar transporter SWEET1 n=1 Tax=Methanobacterium veterum TaxID=408577 RepID=A0A9E4ZWU7_9EURY|nr:MULTISPECIES: SemiSWEET family transporter [Methanobacterium]MCZ3367012.1 SemiSWEET family transporter [Methanobacterium veterum]MCZ3373841.1 SemiSWEET family transporter [Methanobacterium veterum]